MASVSADAVVVGDAGVDVNHSDDDSSIEIGASANSADNKNTAEPDVEDAEMDAEVGPAVSSEGDTSTLVSIDSDVNSCFPKFQMPGSLLARRSVSARTTARRATRWPGWSKYHTPATLIATVSS